MKYFINEEKNKILAYDQSGNHLLGEFKLIDTTEENTKSTKVIKRRKSKAGYGEKTRAIERLVEKGKNVKDVIELLSKEFPTISPSDVYQVRSKLKKAQSSESFTGPGESVES